MNSTTNGSLTIGLPKVLVLVNGSAAYNSSVSSPAIPSVVLVSWFVFTLTFTSVASVLAVLVVRVISSEITSLNGTKILLLYLMLVTITQSVFCTPVNTVATYLALTRHPLDLNCSALIFIRIIIVALECWAELCLAVNRFIAMIFPLDYKRWSRRTVAYAFIVCGWVFSVIPMIHTLFGIGITYGAFPPLYSCTGRPTGEAALPIGMTFGTFFPTTATGVLYLTMFSISKLRKTIKNKQAQRRARLAGMLFGGYMFSMLCYIPMPIMTGRFARVTYGNPAVLAWLTTLQMLGYGANPIVLFAFDNRYKKAALQMLRGDCRIDAELREPDQVLHDRTLHVNQS